MTRGSCLLICILTAQEAKQYCLDNAPPCKPGEVPESLFTDLLKIYFNSEDPKYAAAAISRARADLD